MPYRHEWYIENQVICARLWGKQTIKELYESNRAMEALLDQVEGRQVHILIDDRDLTEIPASLFDTRKTLTYTRHAQLGWVVMYGYKGEQTLTGSVKDFMIATLAKLSRARYLRVRTFAEAVDHLKAVDTTIEWDKVNPAIEIKHV